MWRGSDDEPTPRGARGCTVWKDEHIRLDFLYPGSSLSSSSQSESPHIFMAWGEHEPSMSLLASFFARSVAVLGQPNPSDLTVNWTPHTTAQV